MKEKCEQQVCDGEISEYQTGQVASSVHQIKQQSQTAGHDDLALEGFRKFCEGTSPDEMDREIKHQPGQQGKGCHNIADPYGIPVFIYAKEGPVTDLKRDHQADRRQHGIQREDDSFQQLFTVFLLCHPGSLLTVQ